MNQSWLVVGSERNWKVAFGSRNLWGLKDFRELRALWNMLQVGDDLLFYVSKPVQGIVGFGSVTTKFKQTQPLWPEELTINEVLWPLSFEFDVEYCLPPSIWKTHRYASEDLKMVSRMVFQCCPISEVTSARAALNLKPKAETEHPTPMKTLTPSVASCVTHAEAKSCLAEIGRIQGYIGEEEYPLESTRLDAVWRRVERSVPTFVFEVQIAGDIYHALAKLKHAYDLWNSHIFLVAPISDMGKYEELISGTFHEIRNRVRFIDVSVIKELLEKKRTYVDMERTLGIMR